MKNTTESKYRNTVCITVDFDAVSIWMTWGATGNRAMSRGEFGANVAADRILDMFDKHQIPTTWFIPGHTVDMNPEVVKRVHRSGHEIGNHGYAHESFANLTHEQMITAVTKGNKAIARITGSNPKGLRVPAGDFDGSLLKFLQDQGFSYDSSLVGEYFPSWCRDKDEINFAGPNKLGAKLDLVELPLSFVMNDFCYFEFNYGNPMLTGNSDPDHVFRILVVAVRLHVRERGGRHSERHLAPAVDRMGPAGGNVGQVHPALQERWRTFRDVRASG